MLTVHGMVLNCYLGHGAAVMNSLYVLIFQKGELDHELEAMLIRLEEYGSLLERVR